MYERGANLLGKFERVGIVTVNANGVGGNLDSATVNRFDGAFLDRAYHARYGEVLVGDHGVFLFARHQRAVSHVIAVGEEFLRGGKVRCSPRFDEFSAREAYEHDDPITSIADPMGTSRRSFRACADEIDGYLEELVALAWPRPEPADPIAQPATTGGNP